MLAAEGPFEAGLDGDLDGALGTILEAGLDPGPAPFADARTLLSFASPLGFPATRLGLLSSSALLASSSPDRSRPPPLAPALLLVPSAKV